MQTRGGSDKRLLAPLSLAGVPHNLVCSEKTEDLRTGTHGSCINLEFSMINVLSPTHKWEAGLPK